MSRTQHWRTLCEQTFHDWRALSPGIMAGALAYFACISLPPLALIVGALFGRFFEHHTLIYELHETLGGKTAGAVMQWLLMARQARTPARTVVSFLLLAVIASRMFAHLQSVYRMVWGHPAFEPTLRYGIQKHGLIPALWIVAAGLFCLAFVLLMPAAHWLERAGGLPKPTYHIFYFWLAFGLLTVTFWGMHQSLSPVRLSRRSLWVGALVTATLVVLSRWILVIYFHLKSFSNVYGAAGFLVLIMVWIYFTAHMFVLGTVFTRRYALMQDLKINE